jgi:ATP-dependent helicase/nuclease subunit A
VDARKTSSADVPDGDVRREVAAATGKTMLVEAAAGTGKTTLIVARILEGLRSGALRLPETVAITFTEKAAGELEARVRAGLAAELHRPDLSAAERARLAAALDELDRANISTIHAFCARILKEKSAEAGVDPAFDVLDETGAELLRERAWREWMDAQVAASPPALVEALRAGVGVATLKQMGFALADAPEVLEKPPFVLPVPPRAPEELLAEVRRLAPGVARLFQRHMQGGGNPHSRRFRDAVERIAAGPGDEPAARRLAYALAAVSFDEALKSIKKDERTEVGELSAQLHEAAGGLGAHLAAGLFEWLTDFVAHFAEAKRRRSGLDFQDLLLLAARLLRERPDVRRYFQNRFRAFYVDEFQDTDPLQAEAISYLCEAPTARPAAALEEVRLGEGRLFAVGDPKQSIYRFRRADVHVYERFKALFGEERTRQISCNFRSSPALIEWFNGLFERLFGSDQPARVGAEGVYQAAHVPLQAPHGRDESGEAGLPCVLVLPPAPGLPAAEWSAAESRRREAEAIARTIRAAVSGDLRLAGGPYVFGDFALLFRALSDVDLYEDALEASGVPFRVVGGKHFYRREQVVETLTLLQAVDDPLNEVAVVGALRSSFFAFSDEDLFRYREAGGLWNYLLPGLRPAPVGAGLDLLADWHRSRNAVPPHELLRRIFHATRAQQAFLAKPAGPQRAANLDKLLNHLRALYAAAGNFGAVVRHLSVVSEAEMPEEESNVVEPGDDFVRLMSMHKAKGLEFGAVVLPDLAREFMLAGKVAPLLIRRAGRGVALRAGAGVQSANYERLKLWEMGNQAAELGRLLYVACTRARRLLVLPLYWSLKGNGDSFQALLAESGHLAPPGGVPFGAQQGPVLYLDPSAEVLRTGPGRSSGAGAGGPVPGRPAAEREEPVEELLRGRREWLAMHDSLARHASAAEPFVLPSRLESGGEPTALTEEAGRGWSGRDLGSLFHNLMASLPVREPAEAGDERLVRNLAAVEAETVGLDDAAAAEAAELALRALANAEFRALVGRAESAEQEVAFCVPLAELPVCGPHTAGLLEGSIDLLLRFGEGATVLDYKTDHVRAGAEAQAAQRYWPQLGLYALGARACLRLTGPVEMALFFVRSGGTVVRSLDDEVTEQVRALVARELCG